MPVLTSKQQEQKSKQRKIRNSEYYDMISTFDGLYADSKKDKIFNHLILKDFSITSIILN